MIILEKQEYKVMFENERNNWWYIGMRKITESLIKEFIKNKDNKILDAGCGTGMNMIFLKKFGSVEGFDISEEAIQLCKKRNLSVKKGSIEKIPFKSNYFDIITCFDVIYNKKVKNDITALLEMNRVLKKGGVLIIREPAYKFLFSTHDVLVHTIRRYTLKELKEKLEKTGFIIKRITYANFLLFPIVASVRIMKKLIPIGTKEKSDVQKTSDFTNYFLKIILFIEAHLLKIINFPFGVSVFAIAKKK